MKGILILLNVCHTLALSSLLAQLPHLFELGYFSNLLSLITSIFIQFKIFLYSTAHKTTNTIAAKYTHFNTLYL